MIRCHTWTLGLLLVMLLPAQSSAQNKSGAIITGRITDEETGGPLENVIAFLSSTPVGTSSGKDGTFKIAHLPAGTYELVLSCVGYERQSLAIRIERPESLYYEIKLRAKPVQTKEVEVLGERPTGTGLKLQGLLFPKDSPNTLCIYGTSTHTPIGVFFADSGLYMYTIESAVIKDEKYIRVWLLYKNLSQTPYDFDPMKCVKLHMKGRKYSYNNLTPDPPLKILAGLENSAAVAEIAESVAIPLRSMAKKQTLMEREGIHFEKLLYIEAILHDPKWNTRADKIGAQWYGPAGAGTMSSDLYHVFNSGVNDGVLKRHSVYPDNSVNGYIYFPFPGTNYKVDGTGFPEAFEYNYTLVIATRTGIKTIDFTPGGL